MSNRPLDGNPMDDRPEWLKNFPVKEERSLWSGIRRQLFGGTRAEKERREKDRLLDEYIEASNAIEYDDDLGPMPVVLPQDVAYETPTTAMVRDYYISERLSILPLDAEEKPVGEEFDTWLAQERKEAQKKVLADLAAFWQGALSRFAYVAEEGEVENAKEWIEAVKNYARALDKDET